MSTLIAVARKLCQIWENILFTFGFWTFWLIWNVLGAKWLFRSIIAVIDRADEKDNEKILRRLKALHKCGEAV